MSITADQAAADLEPIPKTKRDRVAAYLIRNDAELSARPAKSGGAKAGGGAGRGRTRTDDLLPT